MAYWVWNPPKFSFNYVEGEGNCCPVKRIRRHLTILGARRMTWKRIHAEDPQALGTTVQNVVTVVIWCLGFVYSCLLEWQFNSVFRPQAEHSEFVDTPTHTHVQIWCSGTIDKILGSGLQDFLYMTQNCKSCWHCNPLCIISCSPAQQITAYLYDNINRL